MCESYLKLFYTYNNVFQGLILEGERKETGVRPLSPQTVDKVRSITPGFSIYCLPLEGKISVKPTDEVFLIQCQYQIT